MGKRISVASVPKPRRAPDKMRTPSFADGRAWILDMGNMLSPGAGCQREAGAQSPYSSALSNYKAAGEFGNAT